MSSIVIADAGPLHYLVLIDCGETLGRLFDQDSSSCLRQLRNFNKLPFSSHRRFSTLLWNATRSAEKRKSDRV